MILTVTMNPSVDISYPLEEFNLDTVNRVAKVSKTPGGKGLNVTRVLKQLDDEVVATGLIGGALGTDIQKKLSKKGIKNDFFEISGETRNCIAILHEGNQSENFLKHFEELVKNENTKIIAISGSLPDGLETNYYSKMIGICEKYKKPVVLDCSGKALIEVLKNNYKPKVIKPNTEELSQLIGKDVSKNPNELKEILKDKLFEKIEWIIVSLGADGAFAKHNDKFYKVNVPKIEVVNPVGSGDSTVAGITSAIHENASDETLLRKANVLGMLNAMEKLTGFVNLERYEELFGKIEVVNL